MLREPHPTAMASLRTAGGIVLGFALLLVICALFAPRNGLFGVRLASVQEVAGFTAYVIGIGMVGVGLLFLQRWAAIILSLSGIGWAFMCVRETVTGMAHPVPGEWNWTGFIFALFLITPTILTAYSWQGLVWWKNAKRLRSVK